MLSGTRADRAAGVLDGVAAAGAVEASFEPELPDVSTQIPAPSNDVEAMTDTVKLVATLAGLPGLTVLSLQAGVPSGGGGTMKFTWYKPG